MSIISLTHGDVIKVTGARYGRQRIGTISGFTKEGNRFIHTPNRDEAEEIARAQELGHKIVWLNAEAVVIAADPSSVDRSFKVEVAPGDLVHIDSEHNEEVGVYRVELPGRMDGDSCKLVRI